MIHFDYFNNYGVGGGADALGNPNRTRLHTGQRIESEVLRQAGEFLDKMAFSLTGDAGWRKPVAE